MKSLLLLLLLPFYSTIGYCFPCFFTLVKGDCWKDFDVEVHVLDANTDKSVTSVRLGKGKLWDRTSFTCTPGEKLYYTAIFTPTIWTGDEKRVYRTKQFNYLPEAPKTKEAAWNIQSCFPDEFAEVPIPTKGTGNCSCDFSIVPPIKPLTP